MQDVRRQLYGEDDDIKFFKWIQGQLKDTEKRLEEGRAVLFHLESQLMNVACDDPGAAIGVQLALPILQVSCACVDTLLRWESDANLLGEVHLTWTCAPSTLGSVQWMPPRDMCCGRRHCGALVHHEGTPAGRQELQQMCRPGGEPAPASAAGAPRGQGHGLC